MEAKDTTTTPVRLDVVSKTGEVIHSSEFVKEKIVLGRILSADMRIDDPRVSRIHALLEVRGETVLLTDLASSHGTYVNGEKIIEHKIKFGDIIRLGFTEIKVLKGSGRISSTTPAFEGRPVFDSEETLVNIDRATLDQLDRRDNDRRQKDAFPDESRLEERRKGERRVDQRKGERRAPVDPAKPAPLPPNVPQDRRSGMDRRQDRPDERRVGERRRGDRRVFDITSLERRIEDRRTRRSEDDVLPEELEKAFDAPDHARELEVTALWGDHILEVDNYAEPMVLSVGESPRNDYIIPSVGIPDEFPLVTIEEDGTAYLAFTSEMKGTIRARDKIYSAEELKEEKFVKKFADYFVVSLKQDDFAKLAIGTVNFFILYVRPAPRVKAAPIFERDALLMRTMISSALLLVFLLVGLNFVPKPKPVTIDVLPEEYRKIVIRTKPKLPPLKDLGVKAPGEDKEGGSKEGVGGPPPGPEGLAGDKNKPKRPDPAQVIKPISKPKETPAPPKPVAEAQPSKAPPSLKPRKVVDKTKSVGLLQATEGTNMQNAIKDLVNAGTGPLGKGGFDDFNKEVKGSRGNRLDESGGAGGLGPKGVEGGGGGKSIGIDGPSTGGLGRGYVGDGIGEGQDGPGRLGKKGQHAISIVSENVQVLSGLSKEVINAVVQRHRAEIRSCYDAALQMNPNLRGKVVIAFTIQPNGVVSAASVRESTLGDRGMEGCILSHVRTWQFPKPQAPVVTEVSAYPFYMNPQN